jgi:hypothetical protein
LHSNVEPASEESKLKLGSASLEGSEGLAVIVVSGWPSTFHVREVTGLSLLAPSVALTSKVCEPSLNPV